MTSAYAFDVTEANFMQQVIDASMQQPVLVDFWAEWCQPCQILKPLLEQLADAYQGKFLLAKLDTEQNQNLAMQFGIRSIPAVKLFKNGEVVDEFMGALPEAQIREFLDKHITSESDVLLDQADAMLVQGQTDAALELVKQANQMDSNNSRALITYARISAELGNFDEAKTVLDALPADAQDRPEVSALRAQLEFSSIAGEGGDIEQLQQQLEADSDNSEVRYQLAAQLMNQGQTEEALQQLLTLMQKDRAYNDDAARKLMFRIFDMLGDHPLVGAYRRKIMSLIY
ncbi:MAG: thioredoxin [Chromatiales bacterium]|jgi:putative thioredoxin